MRRLLILGALVLAFAVLAFDAPWKGVIIAPAGGVRNQATTATPFTIPPGQSITIDCVNDAGTASNALMLWSDTFADAGGVQRGKFSRNTAYWETTAGQSYSVLSVMGNTEPVFCHVTATGLP